MKNVKPNGLKASKPRPSVS
jgi:hypothetical protein